MSTTTDTITSVKALTPFQRWSSEIEAAEKAKDKFVQRARKVTRKFLDERDAAQATAHWFNVYYANVSILSASLYAQLPKPSVNRAHKDYQDDTARVAALIIQRAITQDLDDPRDTFDSTMKHCVQDRLVPGLSMAWLRLETDTEEIPADEYSITEELAETAPQPGMETEEVGENLEMGEIEPPKRITDQRVIVDYVFWEDFVWSPCRIWDERRWVGRRVYMDRDELVKRFGKVKGETVPLDFRGNRANDTVSSSTPKDEVVKKAVVYEIWERATRKVFWFVKGMTELLDEADDPLGLIGFEPCPKPMLANISTSDMTPRPDYYMIQDQYTELDQVNDRISALVKACKVVGVYDKSAGGISRMLQEGADNLLIPVDNWAQFSEKGGVKGQIDWLPLDQVIKALDQLNRSRDAIKAQIYELTGISDIVRGASRASETLGAQEIKAQFAGVRIQALQGEVSRFAGDILRIKAEMMVKHFTPELLIKKSNIMATGNDEFVGQAMELLSTDEGFEWRIAVTADSIAQADYANEKKDRSELLLAVSSYLQKALPMVQQVPESITLVVAMLKWAVAGFRNSAEIEGMLDKELDALVQASKQPKEAPPPSPEEQKAQLDMQTAQQKAQLDTQKAQQDLQIKQQMAAMDMQMKQMELQMKQREMEMELQMKRMEMAMEQQKMQMDMAMEREQMALNREAAQQDFQINSVKQAQSLEFSQQSNEMKLEQSKKQAAEQPKKEPK